VRHCPLTHMIKKTACAVSERSHIPLAVRMENALHDGTWDGEPAEITDEDRQWLDMPSVGEGR
jgi:hypothetical protein